MMENYDCSKRRARQRNNVYGNDSMDLRIHNRAVLATLHPNVLIRDKAHEGKGGADSRMILPTKRDYAKIPEFLRGEWPKPWPEIVLFEDAQADVLRLQDAPWCVVDTEYHVERGNELYQVGLYAPGGQVIIWDKYAEGAAPVEVVKAAVRELAKRTRLVFQHGPADIPVLGLPDDIEHEDTVLMHACCYSEWRHGLEFLESLHGQHPRAKHLGPGSYEYLRGDVVTTALVYSDLDRELNADPASRRIYEQYEKPLTPVILDFRRRGLRVDRDLAARKRVEYTEKIAVAQAIAEAYCGYPINLDSGLQLVRWLQREAAFGKRPKRTKTGRISLGADVLAELRDKYMVRDDDEPFTREYLLARIEGDAHPLLEARAGYIKSRQMLSTFIEPLIEKERIYPNFLPFAQANYRWSTTEPNVAQFPSDLLKLLIPDPDETWLKFDWDGAEARFMAMLAGDEQMLEVLEKGYDFHTLNLCEAMGYPMPPNLVDPHRSPESAEWRALLKWEGKEDPRRTFTKRLIFRLFYGGMAETAPKVPGADALRAKIQAVTGTPFHKKALVEMSKEWIRKHPAVVAFWRARERDARETMTVRTPYGNKRVLFDRDLKRRYRAAYDFPLQGSVSMLMNEMVIALWRATKDEGGRLCYTRHDSITWGLPSQRLVSVRSSLEELVQQIGRAHV